MDGKGTVIFSAARGNNEVVLRVEDSGPGIPQENSKIIFDAFYSTKNTGMGLGLNIVKNLCIKHGWDIRVESKETGSLFL